MMQKKSSNSRRPAGEKSLARLPKPSLEESGEWADGPFLPAALRNELVQRLSDEAKPAAAAGAFVDSCDALARTVNGAKRIATFAETREQMELLADQSRELLKTLQRLTPEAREGVETYVGHSLLSPNAPVPWARFAVDSVRAVWPRQSFLSCAWDLTDALEWTARYAADQLPGDKRLRVKELAGSDLTVDIVRAYVHHFGGLPPTSQDSWFVDFMRALAAHLDVATGPRPVRDAIAKVKRTLPA